MIDDLITLFFKQRSFTDEELSEFKESIIDKIGFKEFKPYENIINLELLKFKIFSKNINKVKVININSKKSNKESQFMRKLINCNIDKLASELEISKRSMISALKTRGFEADDTSILTGEMLTKLKPFINARRKALSSIIRNKKSSISLPPTKGKGTKYTDSVYDKIKLNQGIGKLIYIRKN